MLALPPPVAPPFKPNTGPIDGSLRASIEFLPMYLIPSWRAIAVVVLPSPAFVGVIAVTKISLPFFLFSNSSNMESSILALSFPYLTRYFSSIPAFEAIFAMSSNIKTSKNKFLYF